MLPEKVGDGNQLAYLKKLGEKQVRPDKYVRTLLYGASGTGKTFSLRTAKLPLLIDSFDPGGCIVLSDLIERGDAIIRTEFENEDAKHPSAFAKWDASLDGIEKSGELQAIGTYVIDSATTWAQSALNVVMQKAGRAGGVPQQNDWYPQMVLIEAAIRRIFSFPCDIVLIAHSDVMKDEVQGNVMRAPMLTGKSKTRIPLLFSEVYYADVRQTSKGGEFTWQIQADSVNVAKSRLCGLARKNLKYVSQNYMALRRELGLLGTANS